MAYRRKGDTARSCLRNRCVPHSILMPMAEMILDYCKVRSSKLRLYRTDGICTSVGDTLSQKPLGAKAGSEKSKG